MFTAASLLRQTREDKGFTLEEYSKKLKIPKKYLENFEVESPDFLPPEPYCSLYIKSYADALGLSGNNVLALFRRDVESKLGKTALPRRFSINIFTPEFFAKAGIVVCICIFVIYLVGEYVSFNRPPRLDIAWGENQNGMVVIKGKTEETASVRVNNELVLVNPDGTFEKKVVLPSNSENKTILVESQSAAGKITKKDKIYTP